MSQPSVQLVIGKLLTDAPFRQRFAAHGMKCLIGLREQGIDLNDVEVAALLGTNPRVWAMSAMRIDKRLHRVLNVPAGRAGTCPPALLTARQRRVLHWLCEGLTNKEIAVEEGVSEGAIKATVQQLFRKTGVRHRVRLVRLALEGAFDAQRSSPQ